MQPIKPYAYLKTKARCDPTLLDLFINGLIKLTFFSHYHTISLGALPFQWCSSVFRKSLCCLWQSRQTLMQQGAASIRCLLIVWSLLGVMSFTPSYLRRGWTLCSTGLICGLTSRGNTCCTLCSHAAPRHSSSKVIPTHFFCGDHFFSHKSYFIKSSCDLSRYCSDLLIETVPVTRVDFTAVLPRFLSLYVMSFLSPRDLCTAAQVSWHWRVLAEQVRSPQKETEFQR